MAGITHNVSSTELIIPPTMGAASRLITSEPVPLPNRIGSRPAIVAAAVMSTGRTRKLAPSSTAVCNASALTAPLESFVSLVHAWSR